MIDLVDAWVLAGLHLPDETVGSEDLAMNGDDDVAGVFFGTACYHSGARLAQPVQAARERVVSEHLPKQVGIGEWSVSLGHRLVMQVVRGREL